MTLWLTTFSFELVYSKFCLKFSHFEIYFFFNFSNNLEWRNDQNQNYRSQKDIKHCS
jgi:hypothetical protein